MTMVHHPNKSLALPFIFLVSALIGSFFDFSELQFANRVVEKRNKAESVGCRGHTDLPKFVNTGGSLFHSLWERLQVHNRWFPEIFEARSHNSKITGQIGGCDDTSQAFFVFRRKLLFAINSSDDIIQSRVNLTNPIPDFNLFRRSSRNASFQIAGVNCEVLSSAYKGKISDSALQCRTFNPVHSFTLSSHLIFCCISFYANSLNVFTMLSSIL
jgi:hypothetical protein